MALGCILAQLDDSRKQRAIYYLSKRMLEYEVKYVMIERLCLAFILGYQEIKALHDRVFSAFDIPPRSVQVLI